MIRSAIRTAIRSAISTGINALDSVKRALFNGVDQYATMPAWKSTGANFTISGKIIFSSGAIGSAVNILGVDTGATFGLRKSTGNNFQFSYTDTGAVQRTITVSAVTCVADTQYNFTIDSDGNGVTLTINGSSSSLTNVIDPSVDDFNRLMADDAPGNYTHGKLWDLVFTDESYIQDGDFLQGNGTDLYVSVPSITLVGDFSVVCHLKYPGANVVRFFGNTADTTARAYLSHGSGELAIIGPTNAKPASATVSLATDRHYKFEFRRTGSTYAIFVDGKSVASGAGSTANFIINSLFRQQTFYGVGVTGGVLITSGANTYEYLLNNIIDNGDGTGTAPNTGNTGSSYDGTVYNYDPLVDLTTVANNSRRYPINDQEATLTDTISGQDATIVNHSSGMWV